MAVINMECDVPQSYNLQRDAQCRIGHVEALSVAGVKFLKDQQVGEPLKWGSPKVVGIIAGLEWEGGFAQPLNFTFHVSVPNKQKITELVHSQLKTSEVNIQFTIYDYDQVAKAWFLQFDSRGKEVAGMVQKEGGALQFGVEDAMNEEVQSPQNHVANLNVIPIELEQDLGFSSGHEKGTAKKWGVTVGE
ncbi:hypothetical protein ACFL59_04595 [Planctomycetota bacterium]